MKTHYLKTWPRFFERLANGDKTFEVRKNDRMFQTGDELRLQEWDDSTEKFTSNELSAQISYILHGPAFGIEPGYCVLALRDVKSVL